MVLKNLFAGQQWRNWEICMQAKKQPLELDMEQQTGSKSGKGCIKSAYCHFVYLAYMKNTS